MVFERIHTAQYKLTSCTNTVVFQSVLPPYVISVQDSDTGFDRVLRDSEGDAMCQEAHSNKIAGGGFPAWSRTR